MSADLGPGTPLIFIGPEFWFMPPTGLTIGAMYFVNDVRPPICHAASITLRGEPGNYTEYCSCKFKPVNDGERTLTEEEIDLPVIHPRPKVPVP